MPQPVYRVSETANLAASIPPSSSSSRTAAALQQHRRPPRRGCFDAAMSACQVESYQPHNCLSCLSQSYFLSHAAIQHNTLKSMRSPVRSLNKPRLESTVLWVAPVTHGHSDQLRCLAASFSPCADLWGCQQVSHRWSTMAAAPLVQRTNTSMTLSTFPTSRPNLPWSLHFWLSHVSHAAARPYKLRSVCAARQLQNSHPLPAPTPPTAPLPCAQCCPVRQPGPGHQPVPYVLTSHVMARRLRVLGLSPL